MRNDVFRMERNEVNVTAETETIIIFIILLVAYGLVKGEKRGKKE
jgi:hypothetical protein